MAQQQYEVLSIINPDFDESELEATIENIKSVIETNGGKVIRVDSWGRKRFAYPVKRYTDGYYYLTIFEADSEVIQELNTQYQISEPILRHLIVHFEGDLSKPIVTPRDDTPDRARARGRDMDDDDDYDDEEEE